jgi:hypothetical protein
LGGGAFILLKGGPIGPESAKQAEIRLAIFLKVLQVAGFGTKVPPRAPDRARELGMSARFPPDMANLP